MLKKNILEKNKDNHPDLDWDLADKAIRNGKITEKSGNRIILEHASNDQKHRVVVQIDFDQISQNWLVTVYKKVAESPANPLTTAHDNKGGADNITPENSANNTIPQSADNSSLDSENALQKMRDSFQNRGEILNGTSKQMPWTDIAREYADGKVLSKEANNAVLQEIIDMCLEDYKYSEANNILNAIANNSSFSQNIRKKAESAIREIEKKKDNDQIQAVKQESAMIDKITSAKAGSRDRIMAFTELADGEHTVNGKTFTKKGNAFTLDGKELNAREIEKATRTTYEKMRKTVLR